MATVVAEHPILTAMLIAIVAAVVYTATMALGISAAVSGRTFGRWHHRCFFLSCATALAAGAVEPSWYIVPVLGILAAMPLTKAGTRAHTVVGALGWVAWVIVLWTMSHFP